MIRSSQKSYEENSNNKGYILEIDVEYQKHLFNLHKYLPFLAERKKIEKCKKLVCNIHDKENYVVHIRALKQALNHGLILKKVHKVIQFNQKAWLKPYIDMNTKLRTEAKNDFEKDFFKLMNNAGFGKTMENVRKHRDIKLVTTEHQNLITIQQNMKKKKGKMNKPVYLSMSILDISRTQSIKKKRNYVIWI